MAQVPRPDSSTNWGKEAFHPSSEAGALIETIPTLQPLSAEQEGLEVHYSRDKKFAVIKSDDGGHSNNVGRICGLRQRRGFLLLALALFTLLIIGAVIGGAVGATRKKHRSLSIATNSSSTSSPSSIPSQVIKGLSPDSNVASTVEESRERRHGIIRITPISAKHGR